jgi:hypothetical protein
MFRRLITTGRFRRVPSDMELIAIASTNFVATVARPSGASTILLAAVIKPTGTRFSTNAAPSPKIPIFASPLDDFARDRFNFLSPKTQTVIVSPTFITRNSDFTLRFFISFASCSGDCDCLISSPKRKRMPEQAGN